MIESKYISSHEFSVSSADVDMFGRLRIGSLANMLIQAAGFSADLLGFGYNNLTEKDLFWVLSRLSIQINKIVKWQEIIIVETWPKDVSGLLYLRDFRVKTKAGELIAKASSAWLAIQQSTRRPKIIPDLEKPFAELKDYHALNEVPLKIEPFDGNIISERMVCFTDIDLNQHLTSVRYMDWVIDAIELDFHKQNYPKILHINYIKETAYNERLEIKQKNIGNIKLFEGKNLESNKISFRISMEF